MVNLSVAFATAIGNETATAVTLPLVLSLMVMPPSGLRLADRLCLSLPSVAVILSVRVLSAALVAITVVVTTPASSGA